MKHLSLTAIAAVLSPGCGLLVSGVTIPQSDASDRWLESFCSGMRPVESRTGLLWPAAADSFSAVS